MSARSIAVVVGTLAIGAVMLSSDPRPMDAPVVEPTSGTEQACRFDVFEEMVPPEVHHTCSDGHGRHRVLAVCELNNVAVQGVRHVVQGPWVTGPMTSAASCGINETLVDWGAEGGG
ncbi:hypothetical protein [Pseudonocardia kongjuensis]